MAVPVVAANAARAVEGVAKAAKTVKASSDAQKLINTANKLKSTKVAQGVINKAKADEGVKSALSVADKIKNGGAQSALNTARQIKAGGHTVAFQKAKSATKSGIDAIKNRPLSQNIKSFNNMYQAASSIRGMKGEEYSDEGEYDDNYQYEDTPMVNKQVQEEETKKKKRKTLGVIIGGITTAGCGCMAFPFIIVVSSILYLLGTIQLASGAESSSSSGGNISGGSSVIVGSSVGGAAIEACAREQIGDPYLWGGEGPDEFDCSGLVTYCYRQVYKVEIPHWTGSQVSDSRFVTVSSISQLSAGDIILDGGSDVSHVGIYTAKGTVIHAPRTGDVVKEVSLTQFQGGLSGYETYRHYVG